MPMQARQNHWCVFRGFGQGKVPETARSPQNGAGGVFAVRATDVMVNTVGSDDMKKPPGGGFFFLSFALYI